VRYTEYENVTHNSWDKAYAEPELMKWMLSQKK
jgi:predicted peptidase